MSSYLLFLGVGDVERLETDVDGTKIGIVVKRGDVEKARFALDSATDLLRYYNDYFGVRYPLPKLDILAVPGTGGFWGMENWGAILCFEYVVLVDPRLSTESDRQTVFVVLAHEIAHQWFGNLVTMKWWDDLWLNEGFASWMESKATDHFHPEWRIWLHSEAARQTAMQQDARKTTHPIVQPILNANQAAQAFDFITYNKGQAVIRMLEGYVGDDAFREGVRAYLRKYVYDNTETADFWSELEAMAAGKPIRDVALDFTEQAGVPLISVDNETCSSDGRTHLILDQSRFGIDETAQFPLTWHVPVTAVTTGTATTRTEILVAGPDATPVTLALCAPVKINAGQTAYFRSTYSQSAFDALVSHFGMLAAADQLGLLYDALALGEAGAAPITNFLQLTHKLTLDADPVVWNQLASMLEKVDNLYAGVPDRRGAFRAHARTILAPVFSRLGWDSKPGEANNIAILRETLIDKLGHFDDPAVIDEAQRRFGDFQRDSSSLPAAIRRPTLQVMARKAEVATYEAFHDLARKAESPLEKQQLYLALASGEDPTLAAKSLKIALGDEVPANIGLSMIRRVAADNPDLAWRFALDHLDALGPKLGPTERYGFVPSLLANSTNPDRLSELRDFIDQNIPSAARQNAERAYLELAFRLKVRANLLPEIDRWLTASGIR